MASKVSLGKLPGEPKSAPETTYDLAKETAAGPGTITIISPDDSKKLLGKGSHLAAVDLSGPAYNISNADFLLGTPKNAVQ